MRHRLLRVAALGAALVPLASPAPAGATRWTAIPVPIAAGYLADSGDAASSGRLWRRSDGKITGAPGDLIIRGIRADGTAIAFATSQVYIHDEATVDPYHATPLFFGTYARIAPGGAVTPFAVDPHPAPTSTSGVYGWYDGSAQWHEPIPDPIDWRQSVYGWPQSWGPTRVSANGHVLWGVQRDQYDEWGTTAAGGGVPVVALREAADETIRTYGIDDRGRIAYTTYNATSGAFTSGLTGGPTFEGVCMRSLSSDGYLLVTLPEGCSTSRGLRVYRPDGTVLWERSVVGLPDVSGPYFTPKVLPGGLVAGAATDRTYEVFLVSGGRRVDVAAEFLPALPSGTRLTQVLDGNARRELLVRTQTAGVEGTYILRPTQRLTGAVVDAAGAAVAGVVVTVTTPKERAAGGTTRTTRTDARGRFAFDVDATAVVVRIANGCFGRTAGRTCARSQRVELTGTPVPLRARVDRPTRPVAATTSGVVALRVVRGATSLRLRCLRVTASCAVRVDVVARGVRLAGGSATIAAAGAADVALRLTPAGATRVARGPVTATADARVGSRTVAIAVRFVRG